MNNKAEPIVPILRADSGDLFEESLTNMIPITEQTSPSDAKARGKNISSLLLPPSESTAIVAARHKIVEGAVSMVEMALEELSKKEIVNLDDERKAAMVSNLMIILCGDKDASPVLNTGTLNH